MVLNQGLTLKQGPALRALLFLGTGKWALWLLTLHSGSGLDGVSRVEHWLADHGWAPESVTLMPWALMTCFKFDLSSRPLQPSTSRCPGRQPSPLPSLAFSAALALPPSTYVFRPGLVLRFRWQQGQPVIGLSSRARC